MTAGKWYLVPLCGTLEAGFAVAWRAAVHTPPTLPQ